MSPESQAVEIGRNGSVGWRGGSKPHLGPPSAQARAGVGGCPGGLEPQEEELRPPLPLGCCGSVRGPHLLVARNAAIDSRVDDAVQAHAQQVDVAMCLFVLVLADQGPQLLVFILDHLDGILQRAHLHLRHTAHGVVLAAGTHLPHRGPGSQVRSVMQTPCPGSWDLGLPGPFLMFILF